MKIAVVALFLHPLHQYSLSASFAVVEVGVAAVVVEPSSSSFSVVVEDLLMMKVKSGQE